MRYIVAFLPPPPGTRETSTEGGPSTWLVLAIVALILGAVVLVAWLLKPLVAKRLRGIEISAAANAGTPNARWNESWSRSTGGGDERGKADSNAERLIPPREVAAETPSTAGMTVAAESPPEEVEEVTPVVIESREDTDERSKVEDYETADIVAITSTVRTLLERANAGRVREGFALYSEVALQRFRDEMGLSPEEFDAAFDAVPPPPPDQQAELAAITDIERLADGRIRALVSYGNGGTFPPPEYFTFVRSNGDEWVIDEITTA